MVIAIILISIIYLVIGFLFLSPYETAGNIFGSEYRYLSGTFILVLWLPFVIFFLALLFLSNNRGGWI